MNSTIKKYLQIFDFDGTLAKTPVDSHENKMFFEKQTGIPWVLSKSQATQLTKKHKKFFGPRNGWWGRKETLEPPLVPDPAPKDLFVEHVCEAFHKSKACEETVTIVMTGRHRGIANQVLRILGDGELVSVQRKESKDDKLYVDLADPRVQIYFLGDDGPKPSGSKPSSTILWKLWMIEQFLDIYPDLVKLTIWEDREEHVKEFKQLKGCIEQELVVQHVKS